MPVLVAGERCPSTKTEASGERLRCQLAIGHAGEHWSVERQALDWWRDAPPPAELRELRARLEAEEVELRAAARRRELELLELERAARAERAKGGAHMVEAEARPKRKKQPRAVSRFALLEIDGITDGKGRRLKRRATKEG